MRRVLFVLCVGITVIFPVAAADPPKRPATTTDWDRLQGTWVQVSSEDRGKVKSEADDPYLLTFTGNTLILRSGDRVVYKGEFAIVDSESTPRKYDVTIRSGILPGEHTSYGIFRVAGDELKTCSSGGTGPEARPKGLDSSKNEGCIVFTWQRRK
jgi:uncharacterized protein (TIGR03067 family)